MWLAFRHLSRSRPVGFRAGGIQWAEVEAWQRIYSVRLTPWELDTLAELDSAMLAAAGRETKEE